MNNLNFDPKEEKIAEFIAYLTNSALYKEKNVINLINESNLKRLIAQKHEKKDFLGASELIEEAKRSLKPNIEVSEIISKSIRLPFNLYLTLIESAHKKSLSLSDMIRIISIPAMKHELAKYMARCTSDEVKATFIVDQEKQKVLHDLLHEWENKETSSVPKDEYSCDFIFNSEEEIKTSFKMFAQLSIKERCRKYGFPIELMMDYLKSNLDVEKGWKYLDTNATLSEKPLELTVYSTMSYDFHNYKKFKGSIDSELKNKLDDVLDYKNRMFAVEGAIFTSDSDILTIGSDHYFPGIVSGTLRIEDNKLFFDDVDIEKRTELNALIFETLANEKYTDYAIEEYLKQIHEALAKNDYDTTAQLNDKLAKFQVIQKLSNWYCDLISEIAKGSNVVTFTIPKLSLMLWEATKGNRSIQEFVENLLKNEYKNNIKGDDEGMEEEEEPQFTNEILPNELNTNNSENYTTIPTPTSFGEKNVGKEKKGRRVSFQELINAGFVKDGQILYLYYNGKIFREEEAQIVAFNNKLRYKVDGKLYSKSELAKMLLQKHKMIYTNYVRGPLYWITEDGKQLSDLEEQVRQQRGER
ncbi:MAG: hypothetical protein OIN89_09230 [Candidatus Methanoperedens sp.]|jgi:hypothetical protein|nr:hypothetical protein [Candidatus Methanoperedens sp.]PKL52882.1 MAG: hypothetical protein CVV36_10145 [Candidatus Methanoperedenaceae archaeon HGW-Methanoperedenaceae-1]